MMRNVLILAFIGSLVLSFGVSVTAGGMLFFAATAFLYGIAFLAMALGVYASTQLWPVSSRLAYGIAVPVTAVLIVVFLGWLVGSPNKKLYEVRSLAALLGPYLAANAGAYWLVVNNKI